MNEPSAAQKWLESIPILTHLEDSQQRAAFESLIGHEGFRLFLGLLLGSRQAFYVALAAHPVFNAEGAARASVIQGQIKGIDLARQTVLDTLTPDGAQAKEQ